MFFPILVLLEIIVVIEGWIAYTKGYLTRSQGKRSSGRPVFYFIEHGGMWGDFFLISPLTAFLISRYHTEWSLKSIIICLLIAAGLGAGMLNEWRKGKADEVFNEGGKVTVAGWIHYGYILITLPAVFLYYFATPVELTADTAILVSSVLAVHVPAGLLFPEYVVEKRISRKSLVSTIVCWAALLVGLVRILSQ